MPNKKSVSLLSALIFITSMMSAVGHAQELSLLTHQLKFIDGNLPAPKLGFHNLDEEIVNIEDFKGNPVIVNFWATWCPPCRREMGSLERLYKSVKAQGVEVLAVNIGEDIDTVFPFMGTIEPSPSFPILFDPDAVSMERWKVLGLPTTYVVNADGELSYRAVGGRDFDHPDIRKKILELVRQ